jgi:Protein of unknown function (DUF998)
MKRLEKADEEFEMAASLVSTSRGATLGADKAAIALAVVFVALVAFLHVVRADLAPPGHVLSEYALGATGWIMALAFFALAGSFAALLAALWRQLIGWRGLFGRAMLAVAAIGSTMGGLFTMDPVGTPPDQASLSAQLHNVAFMLGGPGTLLAATFVNWSLVRDPALQGARTLLAWTAAFVWLAMIVFFIAVSMLMSDPSGGDKWIGIWNRLLVLSWVTWVVLLAHRVMTERRHVVAGTRS